jgi:hypothetical protein
MIIIESKYSTATGHSSQAEELKEKEMVLLKALLLIQTIIFMWADFGNDRIQKFSNDGQFLAKWGTSGSEVGQFMGPAGLAVDLNDSTAAPTVGISPDTTFYPIMTSYSKTY